MNLKRRSEKNAPANRIFSRKQYLSVIDAAIVLEHYHFANDASLNWLGRYPGDLQAGLLYSKALVGEGYPHLAKPIIEGLCLADPEYIEAIEYLQKITEIETRVNNKKSNPDQSYPNPLPKSVFSSSILPVWLYSLRGPRVISKGNPGGFDISDIDDWGQSLWKSRRALGKGDLGETENLILYVLGANPPIPLVHVTHLQYLDGIENTPLPARLSIAQHYSDLWPNCLQIKLLLAHWMMDSQNQDQAVKMLYDVATHDMSGQVISRLWGENHPYDAIWQNELSHTFSMQIPAAVSARLGMNLLSSTSISTETLSSHTDSTTGEIPDFLLEEPNTQNSQSQTSPSKNLSHEKKSITPMAEIEYVRSFNKELEKIAKQINRTGISGLDGRFPIYVLFTSRIGLENKYGIQAANQITQEATRIVDTFQSNSQNKTLPGWGARLFMPDDPNTRNRVDKSSVDRPNPWELKLALRDLDDTLSQRGEMIGAVLIIGGPEIIPFHHLPNPVDDPDDYITSDNPYGTRDENYFIPEWPVGRLPGGRGTDPNLLIKSLQKIWRYHSLKENKHSWYHDMYHRLIDWLRPNPLSRTKSLGYTAEVWRSASQAVFSPIGATRNLFSSPPVGVDNNGHKYEELPPISTAHLGYFNLHGLVDAPEWYGQSDPQETLSDPEYPIALRPQDISINGSHRLNGSKSSNTRNKNTLIPEVVFSEACYGANIVGKSVEEALSLTFLSTGTRAMAGSTSMSYGSITSPLIAADLLGHAFWLFLRNGVVAGEALRQAKIYLGREMNNRQGYLDGEDQKTLISFIFYGDPLAQFKPSNKTQKTIARTVSSNTSVHTVCDRSENLPGTTNFSAEDVEYVKHVVNQYLPGMFGARMTCAAERAVCHAESHQCPTSQLSAKGDSAGNPSRKVITLKKQIENSHHIHNQYARLTLDGKGKLVKLVVSR